MQSCADLSANACKREDLALTNFTHFTCSGVFHSWTKSCSSVNKRQESPKRVVGSWVLWERGSRELTAAHTAVGIAWWHRSGSAPWHPEWLCVSPQLLWHSQHSLERHPTSASAAEAALLCFTLPCWLHGETWQYWKGPDIYFISIYTQNNCNEHCYHCCYWKSSFKDQRQCFALFTSTGTEIPAGPEEFTKYITLHWLLLLLWY